MKNWLPLAIVLLLVLSLADCGARTILGQDRSAPLLPIDVNVPALPIPVRSEGQFHFVYELHVTNFASYEMTLWRIEVQTDDGDLLTLGRYEGADLAERIQRPGVAAGIPDKRRLAPGMRAIIYLWVSVDARSKIPGALLHRITFSRVESGKSVVETVVESARIKTGISPGVLGPPLKGGNWLAGNGPSNESLHRRALKPVEGKATIAQRFAVDWVKVGNDGQSWTGDRLKNSSYHAYGQEVLAVADGIIDAITDGIPENVPGPTSRAVAITLDTIAGNYVLLNIGKGLYALYGHLQPGSLRVKKGDKVKSGQVLGLVGNSGNSTQPHLHFHICDGESPLASEGLPFVFDSFDLLGRGTGSKQLPETRRLEMPLENFVVRFKEQPLAVAESPASLTVNPADVATVDAVLAALYDVISGPAGKKRDWNRFRSLFSSGARLIPTYHHASGAVEIRQHTVDEYISRSSAVFEQNGFFEREIARTTESFGHIVQVFSTYESRRKPEDATPFSRGINSIQLFNDGKRWWIITVFWQSESPGNSIPKKYLKGIKR